ncbi:uncharacterized protein LOC132745883 isoform X2 [Ruditapes philippinarum]|uniref:uncharacterized protein LOC132745883 isoform X2 n=1 Tax=Ruditapes philippinarum TaxID=129788 RepID=UPI00295BAAA6|nr:uncharacterized protein LOC132745883 isoform X2 [Ruditapes philippinarum]
MKFTLVLLVLFVASTCTSAYFLKRGRGGPGAGKPPKSGSASGTNDGEKSGPRRMCREVVEFCMMDDEERSMGDADVTEKVIKDCIKEVEEEIVDARRELVEDLGPCKSALEQCLAGPPPPDQPLRRALTLMLREEDLQNCEAFLESLPEESVDENDGGSMSQGPPPTASGQNLRRFLYKMLNKN